jgi:hypothetical protein
MVPEQAPGGIGCGRIPGDSLMLAFVRAVDPGPLVSCPATSRSGAFGRSRAAA